MSMYVYYIMYLLFVRLTVDVFGEYVANIREIRFVRLFLTYLTSIWASSFFYFYLILYQALVYTVGTIKYVNFFNT